ncbi:unnamed protein product [Enterobius vermicularis]|uniref:Uncharacterized protein n=1 Tax=Enterobius vermicularis TaxID=51028 RepID=A0A0N4UYC7_ENTVE|nr:unnamed protein product [Enterobius vermicularis]
MKEKQCFQTTLTEHIQITFRLQFSYLRQTLNTNERTAKQGVTRIPNEHITSTTSNVSSTKTHLGPTRRKLPDQLQGSADAPPNAKIMLLAKSQLGIATRVSRTESAMVKPHHGDGFGTHAHTDTHTARQRVQYGDCCSGGGGGGGGGKARSVRRLTVGRVAKSDYGSKFVEKCYHLTSCNKDNALVS